MVYDQVEADSFPSGNAILLSTDDSPSTEDIAAFVRLHYGVSGVVTMLGSERDANYAIASTKGRHHLFKLAHSAEDPAVVDLQTLAFQHVHRARPSIPVQRLVATLEGDLRTDWPLAAGGRRLGWLLTYVAGAPLSSGPVTPAHAAQLGAIAADLDVALSDFRHPAAARGLLWDIQHAAQTRVLLRYTLDDDDRLLCEQALDRFERHTAPALAMRRSQVIHNDLNPYNVIAAAGAVDRITGVIDFGDMVAAPMVNEIAVAAAYWVSAGDAPLGMALECIAAYHSHNPLEPEEVCLVPSLMAVRQAITVAITNWRASLHPENRRYIVRNQASVLAGLRKVTALGEERAGDLLQEACSGIRG